MELHLQPHGLQRGQVYEALRAAILEGRLAPGAALPATRELAAAVGVSRNTILSAYGRLQAEGFLEGRRGSGTYVAADARVARPAARAGALAPRPIWTGLAASHRETPAARWDFRLGAPDPRLFPWDGWRRALAHQLRGRRPASGYGDPGGEPRLRAAIAAHLARARGVRCAPEDVLVTAGAQQGFDLAARVLVSPGEIVAVEDPGHPAVRRLWQAQGLRVLPVHVDHEGIVVDALPDRARLVHVTPSHQFPVGVTLSLARRLALLEWAARRGAAILEDDYDSEFRFDGRPLEPLQRLDRQGHVLYAGTFSKVLSPNLRLGFLVPPRSLAPALHEARRLADAFSAPEPQRALAELMEEGLHARHVRRVGKVYAGRRARLLDAVDRHLGGAVEVIGAAAGLHVAVKCRSDEVDPQAWAARAASLDVAVAPLAGPSPRAQVRGLALGYGLIAEADVEEGIRRLAGALGESRSGARR